MKDAIFLGSIAGIVGTGTGGLLALLLKNLPRSFLSGSLCFAGGLMIAIVCFDLLPEAYHTGGIQSAIVGVLIGVVFMIAAEKVIGQDDGLLRAGGLLAISIALHNLPEGLAIGAGFAGAPALGLSLGIAIALHDLPEGLSLVLPLRAGGMSAGKALAIAVASGIPTSVGSALGYALAVHESIIGVSLGIAAGAMLYVVCGEILMEAGLIHRGIINPLSWTAGLLLGYIMPLVLLS